MQAALISLQKLLITYQRFIKWAFVVGELTLVMIWLTGIGIFIFFPYQDPQYTMLHFLVYEVGRRMGYVALGFYLLSLLPGIISRIKWQPLLGTMIMPFRRHLGIAMFIAAFIHMSFTTTLPGVLGGTGLIINTPKLFGMLAMLLLFPLWLTSNNPSQRFLGKKWKVLHRLTYIVLLLVFLHIAFFRKRWAIPTFGVLSLEAVSWLLVWWRARQVPPASAAAPTPPATS